MIIHVWITEYGQGKSALRTRLVAAEVLPRLTDLQLQHLDLGLEVVLITSKGARRRRRQYPWPLSARRRSPR